MITGAYDLVIAIGPHKKKNETSVARRKYQLEGPSLDEFKIQQYPAPRLATSLQNSGYKG